VAALQRVAAVLVILLAGLSLLVSTQAYQVARPVNPAQVPIVSTDQGALKVEAGPNNPFSMVTIAGGRLVLDMTKGPGNATNLGFAANSRYTLYRIIRITNTTGSAKNVSVTVSGGPPAALSNVSGYIGGSAFTSGPTLALPIGQFVDINLEWTATAAGTSSGMMLTVTGN
jgi:hypothetical protein